MGNYESTETMGKGKTIKYNANKGLCINLHNDLQESGAEINLWQCNKHQSQRWEVEVINDDGVCLIHYAANPKFVINLHCAAEENGAVINLWEKNGNASQEWKGKQLKCDDSSASSSSEMKEVYWKVKGTDRVYYSEEGVRDEGVSFETPEEYFEHRANHGFDESWDGLIEVDQMP